MHHAEEINGVSDCESFRRSLAPVMNHLQETLNTFIMLRLTLSELTDAASKRVFNWFTVINLYYH